MAQSLEYVPTPAERAYSEPDANGRTRPITWDVPVAHRPEVPRFCERRSPGEARAHAADHRWVQWYTEAGRRMYRVMYRCDAHAPEIIIRDTDTEALAGGAS